jgi:plastocyanin
MAVMGDRDFRQAPPRHRLMRAALPVALVTAGFLLSACAGGSSSGGSAGGTDLIKVSVSNGEVHPADHREDVSVGDTVKLTVSSDRDDMVHVHGVNIEKPVSAGGSVTITFKVTDPGIYEVETHESDLTLLQIEAR